MRFAVAITMALAVLPLGAQASTQEKIGSWLLSCPADGPCLMRLDKPIAEKVGAVANLEVMRQGRALVPVITLRGVPNDLLAAAAVAGKASVQVRFPGAPPETLDCVASSIGALCAPDEDAAPRLASALTTARSVTLRLTASLSGMQPLPVQQQSLALSGTAEGLRRLRSAGATPVPEPITELAAESPAALIASADRWLKAAGYKNGVAGLQALLQQYRPPAEAVR
jgi:hypothetical protein